MKYGGCYTSRVVFWNSKTYSEERAQSDLPFLSYGQKTAIFVLMKKAIFGYFYKIVSLIEPNPSPWVLEFLYTSQEKELAQLDILLWRNSQK